MSRMLTRAGVVDDRHDQALFQGDGHADMHLLFLDEPVFREGDVDLRHADERLRHGLDDQVVEADLDRRWVGRGVGVDLRAQLGQFAGIDYAGDVEMRRGLHALAQAARDGAAHGGERDLDRLAYLDGCGRHGRGRGFGWLCKRWSLGSHSIDWLRKRHRRRRRSRRRDLRRLCRGLSKRGFNIQLNDAPIRAGAANGGVVYALHVGKAARQGRDEGASPGGVRLPL